MVAFVGITVSVSSLVFYSFGLFFEPLQSQFGWTRGQISGALLYMTIGMVLSAPLLGWLMDRYGARTLALVSIPMLALVFFGLSKAGGSLPVFYALFFAAGALGSGTTPIVYTRIINAEFTASRGLALGIALAGSGVAAFLLPPLLVRAIGAWGWASGYLVLAVAAMLALPLAALGLSTKKGTSTNTQPRAGTAGMSTRAAVRTSTFWITAVTFVAVAAAISGLIVHLVPMLKGAGLDTQKSAQIASLVGVGVLMGRIAIGWFVDRFFAPRVASIVFLVAVAGCVLLNLGTPASTPIAAIIIGIALGAEVDLLAYLTSRYFGLKNYGVLYGIMYSLFGIGSALGPALMGYLFDSWGSYHTALWTTTALLFCSAIGMLTLPAFDKHERS